MGGDNSGRTALPESEVVGGYRILERLGTTSGARLLRAQRPEESTPVLLRLFEPATPAQVARFRREYDLLRALDLPGVVKPLDFFSSSPYLGMVLADCAGELLESFLRRQRPDLALCLRLGVRLAEILTGLHAAGVIHQDLRPANLLIDPQTARLSLVDFGLAMRNGRGTAAPASAFGPADDLAYLSPEQTGRMNRVTDYRSDLYSVGIILYRLLTGQLPFAAGDALEWVHCHLARLPVPPAELDPEIPQPVSDLVIRLLAKEADDRYQSAHGLLYDLELCLKAWQSTGRIAPFALGMHDVSDRFLIPQKLYGREAELAVLLAAFERMAGSGRPELVLISGYSGIGKSSLVQELHKPIVRERGSFIFGKFDQYQRDMPYATFAQAFHAPLQQILTQSRQEIAGWRQRLREALGINAQIIIDVIPELELIIGKQPPVQELSIIEAQNRFHMVFRQFLAVFARPGHPLVLFLDDLQWLDSGSLKLLEDLVTYPQTRHLLLIGAYRDNEVGPSHPLMLTLGRIRKTEAVVEELTLTPLSPEHLGKLVADALRTGIDEAAPLARLVHEKTAGNPFFAIQFLTALHGERLIEFDHETAGWRWDLAKIHTKGFTDNVVDLMVRKLRRLPVATRDMLKLAACVGNTTDLHTLAIISDRSEDQVEVDIEDAVREGLILRQESRYSFLHDRVQQGAYTLIADERRKAVHLRIGRLLRASSDRQRQDEGVFDIVNQFNRGLDLITDPAERDAIARLNLAAGRKAKASIAYAPARNFFTAATKLLPEDPWSAAYDFAFALFRERAQCAYLCGDFEEAEDLFDLVLARSRSDFDRVAVYELRLKLYHVAGRYDQCVALGLQALRLFGVEIPDDDAALAEATRAEAEALKVGLAGRRIADLADAPEATDPRVRAIIGLLSNVAPAAYIGSRPQLFPLIILKLVSYSLRFGHTCESCMGYSAYGLLLVSLFDDPFTGYEFSEMSISLNRKLGDISHRGTVLHLHGDHINFWLRPIASDFPILEQGFLACLDAGNLVFACAIAFEIVWQAVERGDSLDDVLELSAKYAAFARESRNDAVYQTIRIEQQFVRCLKGQTRTSTLFDDDGFAETACLQRITDANFTCGIVFYRMMKTIVAWFADDLPLALKHAEEARRTLSAAMAMPMESTYYFIHALVLARMYPGATAEAQQEVLDTLARYCGKLGFWAKNCPENFRAKHALVAAELARLTGDALKAEARYEEAIGSARENGFSHWEGIANELAAGFYRERGLRSIADMYLRQARSSYLRWGADAKVRRLDQRHPELVPRQPQEAGPLASCAGQLDVLTALKASQAISREIVLDRLLDTLMRIVIESAGAQQGLLLLARGDALTPAAEASAVGQEIEVRIHSAQHPVAAAEMPVSVVNYVRRSREKLILDDAAAASAFAADEYFCRRRPQSVLCLPILRQAELVGLLYLENKLVTHAFTLDRLAVLELLATQAAISIANARLYADLQQENAERKRAEEALRESQRLLQSIIDNSTAVIYVKDRQGHYLLVNRRFEELFHVTRESVAGRTDYDLFPKERADAFRAFDEQVMAAGTTLEAEEEVPQDDGVHTYISIKAPVRGQRGRAYALCGISTDITERKQIDRMKDEFISTAAHELRTPLTTVMGYLELLLESGQTFSPQEHREFLELVYRNSEALARIISDLLDLSTVHAGRLITLRKSLEDIGALAGRAVAAWQGLSDRHQFSLEFAEAPVDLCLDSGKIGQVLENLLSNAVKFSPAGGAIRVSGHCRNGEIEVTVEDEGIGMGPEQVARIFDKFYRADASDTAVGGLGLGMSIVRNIVQAHGGRIWVESEPGRGTRVHFTVPTEDRAGECTPRFH